MPILSDIPRPPVTSLQTSLYTSFWFHWILKLTIYIAISVHGVNLVRWTLSYHCFSVANVLRRPRCAVGDTTKIAEHKKLTIVLFLNLIGCPTPHKGVITYTLSPNRQRPLAGAAYNAVFNTWRRFRGQVLYVAPPFIFAYAAMNWAVERYADKMRRSCSFFTDLDWFLALSRNEYLNSKPGRLAEGGDD